METGRQCGEPKSKTGDGHACNTHTGSVSDSNVSLPPTFGRILPINSDFLRTFKCFTSEPGASYSTSSSSLLLEGPLNTHRTSLLFQAAVSFTIEGAVVCYVCPKSFTRLPPGVHGMHQPNPASAQRLKMMYMQRTEELVGYLASLHELPAPPDVLIIDDLHLYVSQNEDAGLERSVARLCAHLVDALNTMETKSESKNVHLLIGTDHVSSTLSDIWPQFFPAVFSLTELSDSGCIRMVPVSSTRRQVAVRWKRPLVSVDYTVCQGTLRLVSVHSTQPEPHR